MLHKNTYTHGCHRHPFSRFPDFSLLKISFPWPKNCKMPGLVVNASSACSLMVINSFRSQWTQMLLPTFNVIKSAVLNYYNFLWLLSKMSIYPESKAAPSVSEYFWIRNFFFPVRLPSTRIRWIRQRIQIFLTPLSRVEKFHNESDDMWTGQSGYFWIRWHKNRVQSLTEQQTNMPEQLGRLESVLLELSSSLAACMRVNLAMLTHI